MQAIEKLMEKKGKFDYVLLETSGLANPGASLLFISMPNNDDIDLLFVFRRRTDCLHILDGRRRAVAS